MIRVILSMLAATFLWALSGTAVAVVPDLSIGAMAFGAGIALLLTGALRSDRTALLAALRANVGFVAVVIVLDIVNFLGYYTALRLGPPPVVTALHLTGPVIVMAWYVLRRRRKFDWTVAVQVALIVGAILLLTVGRDTAAADTAHGSVSVLLIACAMSLATAFSLAALNLIVGHSTLSRSQEFGVGTQLLCVGIVVSGLEASTGTVPSGSLLVVSLLLGSTCTAPATLLLWKSLSRAEVTFVTTLGMTEGVWTVVMIAAVTSHMPSMVSLAGGAMIALAALVEVRCGRSRTTAVDPVETESSGVTTPEHR